MKQRKPSNVAASVRQRLLNLSRQRGEDFNLVLTQYGIERWLYRLGQSEHSGRFVLKGAILFTLWAGRVHRPTRDLDLLGYGDFSTDWIEKVFRDVSHVTAEDDGLAFDPDTIRSSEIREDQEYHGLRVRLRAYLGSARIELQIDVGFGDVITPDATDATFPTLLDMPSPKVRAYPPETVIAEKLQAMVSLGIPNSRMKDYFDVWSISRQFDFDGQVLSRAIGATFDRRRTPVPLDVPPALSEEFANAENKSTQWRAFLRRTGIDKITGNLAALLDDLRRFLLPPMSAATQGEEFNETWTPRGGWSKR